jgi:hypothetical protein
VLPAELKTEVEWSRSGKQSKKAETEEERQRSLKLGTICFACFVPSDKAQPSLARPYKN